MSANEHVDVLILGGGIVGLWAAREARKRGLSVCVLEVGGRSLDAAEAVHPSFDFPERENLGATRARHHVLTGNSAFWGGALADNGRPSLARVCGTDPDDPMLPLLEAHALEVKKALGVNRANEAWTDGWTEAAGFTGQEVTVLPGKRRGLWSECLDPRVTDRDGIDVRTGARVVGVEATSDGKVSQVRYLDAGAGGERVLSTSTLVLAMGVLDSNLFALEHLRPLCTGGRARHVGTMLHDHWSLPVLDIEWKNQPAGRRLFPPRFTKSGIVGRRLGFEGGFFHVVADYDNMPPYDRVKKLLAARQRGVSGATALALAASTAGRPFKMAAAGIHYLLHRELLVPNGTSVRLVCDFESAAAESNAVTIGDERASLRWGVRPPDRARFLQILRTNREPLERLLGSCGLGFTWRVSADDEVSAVRYFEENAIDAYHLGGGLAGPASLPEERVVSPIGRMLDLHNVFVMSTASFFAPGDANPVLTLLARVGVVLDEVTKGN